MLTWDPFIGTEYGEVRQYGNYSFLRIYEAGHEVPFYQPVGSLAAFSRILGKLDLATGTELVEGTYETNGTAEATHTEEYVAIPTATGSGAALSYTAAITVPITSVPSDGYVVVESPTSVSTSEIGRFAKLENGL